MIVRNKLGKTFGPYPAFAGIVLFIAGIFFFRHPVGILLLLAGSFLATTTDETQIDVPRKRIRSVTRMLLFVTPGKWQDAGDFAGLTLIPFRRSYSVHSLSNKHVTTGEKEYRIHILNKQKKPVFALKKFQNREDAREEMDLLSQSLDLPVFKAGEE